jgi:hypothetical protein
MRGRVWSRVARRRVRRSRPGRLLAAGWRRFRGGVRGASWWHLAVAARHRLFGTVFMQGVRRALAVPFAGIVLRRRARAFPVLPAGAPAALPAVPAASPAADPAAANYPTPPLPTGSVNPEGNAPMHRIFAGAADQLANDVAGWEPVNVAGDPSAQAMRMVLHDVPDYADHQAAQLDMLANKIREGVMLDPAAHDLLHSLATQMRSLVDQFREVAHGIDQLHGDRLEHMRSSSPLAGSWDWKGNQDADVAG